MRGNYAISAALIIALASIPTSAALAQSPRHKPDPALSDLDMAIGAVMQNASKQSNEDLKDQLRKMQEEKEKKQKLREEQQAANDAKKKLMQEFSTTPRRPHQ
jgi:ATP-dependent Clp protease ATP-binding subunit ClpA